MKPITTVPIVANKLRPAPAPMAELGDEELSDALVACAEPGAPEERVTAPEPAYTNMLRSIFESYVKTYLRRLGGWFCCRLSQCMHQTVAC